VKPLTAEALHACLSHPWKGNARELRSALEQALLLASGPEITARDLFGAAPIGATAVADPQIAGPAQAPNTAPAPQSFREAKERVVQAFERDFLLQALRRHAGNITKAAEEIGLYRQSLQQKMRELGINAEDIGQS